MQGRISTMLLGDREDPRERLAALFGGEVPESGQPPAPAMDWARTVLADQPESISKVEAIRLIRAAEPRLTLKSALFLAQHALDAR